MAFELAYLKLGIHRSMAWHSCQVTYYNISSPVLRGYAHKPTGKVCAIARALARARPRIGRSTPSRTLYTSRVLCLCPTYADSKHAYVRVISLICMCLSSKGEQNHPNIFTCANRMYSQCKMHPPPSPSPSPSSTLALALALLTPRPRLALVSRSSTEKF